MRVKWLREALKNVDDEASYLATESPVAAAKFLEQIFDAVWHLSRFPSTGRPGRVAGTRESIVSATPYIVAYRVRNQAVETLRVFHSSRKWPERL